MTTVVKVVVYLLLVAAVYVEEYNVPVMLHIKRARFLADWKIAAFFQRQALESYYDYQEEAEHVRG